MCKTAKKRTSDTVAKEGPSVDSFLSNSDYFVPNVKLKVPASQSLSDVQPEKERADDANGAPTPSTPSTAAKLDSTEDAQSPSRAAVREDVYEGETSSSSSSKDHAHRSCCEAGTLTEISYREDLAEVNLISLIEEQIPRYVLKADLLTDYAGYDHEDFTIQTPLIPPDANLELTTEQIEETLKYFTLCSTRVSQMTKTYHDIGAVTRLLEEKERDLELAARIGQKLLERNKDLSNKNEELEQQLTEATDKISQLKHDVAMKDALLQVYVQDYEGDSDASTPEEKEAFAVDTLQKKVKSLEEQNKSLKLEAAQLNNETTNYEEEEHALVNSCVRQLDELNERVDIMAEEIAAKNDVNLMQQEEISALLGQTINLEGKNKKLVIDNAELNQHLAAAQEAQKQLTAEIAELEEKYQECFAHLQEAQEEIKALRKKQKPSVVRQHYSTFSPFPPEGSLASELEDSMRSSSSPSGKDRRSHSKRVMETAKYIRRSAQRTDSQQSLDKGSTSGNESCESIAGSDTRSSLSFLSENSSQLSDSYADSMYSTQSSNLGRPGIPGSNDLETALRRLSLRRANEINESMFHEEQHKKRSHGFGSSSTATPAECQTPDSYMSTGSGSNLSDYSRFSGFRYPDKLQIVKPMEGSLTLHRWQRLATPHLGGLLEDRPGVQIKGERKIDIEEEVYCLSDFEEDDDYNLHPGKCLDQTSSTYTFTNATIMHPNDVYATTTTTQFHSSGKPSVNIDASKTASVATTTRADATTTFSMNSGLAASLHERFLNVPGRTAPARFQSIVTETLSNNAKCPQMETLYTSASLVIPPIQGMDASVGPLKYQPEDAYLNLVGRIKDIGLNNILNIAHRSELGSLENDPVNIGLNSIMGIRRNKSRVASRGSAHHLMKAKTSAPVTSTPKSGNIRPSLQVPSLSTIAEHLASAPVTTVVTSTGALFKQSSATRPTTLLLTSSSTQQRSVTSVLPSGVSNASNIVRPSMSHRTAGALTSTKSGRHTKR